MYKLKCEYFKSSCAWCRYLLFRAVSTRRPDCLLPLAEREVIHITYHWDKKAYCEDRIFRNAVYFCYSFS